jgi:UDP-glucose 4-epimerase
MKVLITGGAGFIGSHLCDAFVAEGHSVTVLDNFSTGSKKNIVHLNNYIEIFNGDIRDQFQVESLIEGCDLVLHMAAALGVKNILDNPIESISTNFNGSENVLKSSLKYNKRIIVASTSEIYGKNPHQPLTETDDRLIGPPQKIRWTYSDAKALEEAIAHYLFITEKLKVTTVRLFNTVGPRQTGKYGMVLPRLVRSALNEEPLQVYGDGNQSRVFCHVLDVVDAIIKLAINDRAIGEVFNIGGVEEVSINNLANRVISILSSKSKIQYLPYEMAYSDGYEDMNRRVPNISKIKKFVNWSPKYSLDQIILDIKQYEDQKNLDQP